MKFSQCHRVRHQVVLEAEHLAVDGKAVFFLNQVFEVENALTGAQVVPLKNLLVVVVDDNARHLLTKAINV
jgi:hypothetical protein